MYSYIPTEQMRPSEISTDFVKVGEREQNESSAAAPSVWNSGSPTREGGRAKMHQLFAALASLTRGEKRWRGIEIEEVAVAGGGGGSADIIGDREENISGGGKDTALRTVFRMSAHVRSTRRMCIKARSRVA